MSDPRATPRYDGSLGEYLPFIIDGTDITFDAAQRGGSAVVGRAVTLSGNRTVRLCGDGDPVLGRLESVESDGRCSVRVGGGCVLPAGNGATVTAGSKIVGALGAASARGFIRNVAAPGASYVQAEATDSARARHTILDAATATAVVVLLGK